MAVHLEYAPFLIPAIRDTHLRSKYVDRLDEYIPFEVTINAVLANATNVGAGIFVVDTF